MAIKGGDLGVLGVFWVLWATVGVTAPLAAQQPAAKAAPAVQAPTVSPKPEPLPSAHRPTLSVSLSPQKGVATGDLVHLRIVAEAAAGDEVAVPEQNLGAFEIRAKRSALDKTKTGRQRYIFELDLLATEPGEREIAPVELRVVTAGGLVGSVSTAPLKLRVNALLGNQPNAKLKPSTQPVSVLQDDYTALYVLGAIAAAAAIAALTLLASRWWRKREKKLPPPPPPRPPWEVAMERLFQLEQEKATYLQRGSGAEFVDRVSDTLREYLGARFAGGMLLCDGLETTSDEMIRMLRDRGVGTDLLREIADFLFHCDLIKFAKVVPDHAEADEILAKARQTVQTSTPASVAPSPAIGPETPAPGQGPVGGIAPSAAVSAPANKGLR